MKILDVCRINLEIYRAVTPDISNDEVIITERQIEHIKQNHPNVYELYSKYFTIILTEPDYIIEGKGTATALILKRIVEEDKIKAFKLVLRLQTSKDPAEFKNSIKTFIKSDVKELERLLRSKKILYKRPNM